MTKPNHTFLPWMEVLVFHCLPHQMLAKFAHPALDCVAAAKEELRNVKAKATLSKFGLERFGPDNESIKFYTGFPTNEHIKLFFNFIKPSAELMTY